jgi:AcrR family transcriptional regulator
MLNNTTNKRTPPSGKPAPEPRRDMEAAILEAAERLFQAKGYARVSTTEIAREAGCNQALVHYYYRTKENLFETIFERKFQQFFGQVRAIEGKDASFEERLAARIEAHFDILFANPGTPSMVVTELLTNPERVRSLKERFGNRPREMVSSWKREIDEEVRKGSIRPTDTLDLFLTILSLNAMPFIAGPILKEAVGIPEAIQREMLRRRGSENVRIVLASLRPDPSPDGERKAPRTAKGRSRR